jgi:hypothetical protein
MGFLDKLLGRKPKSDEPQAAAPAADPGMAPAAPAEPAAPAAEHDHDHDHGEHDHSH